MTKLTPLKLGKTAFTTAKRLHKTASIAGLSALRVAKGEKPDAYLLKETFEKLGVTYIKLGQFIASTPSLFPKEYVVAFADCLDNTTPIAFGQVLAVLESEFAHLGGVDAVFAHIDPAAIASASIAQVHKATLKTGETVAIKVQKPNVGTIIATDLGVLHGLFWMLEKVVPSFKMASLAPMVDEIKTRMADETDFVAESRHLRHFAKFLADSRNQNIIVPSVYDHLTTKRVLTMSFIEGRSLIDKEAFGTVNPAVVMGQVLDTWLLSLMMTGEFHADLHAGNLLLTADGKVAFLDFGLVGHIAPKSLKACMSLVQAMGQNDYIGVAQAMIDMGMTDEHKVSADGLANDLQMLLGNNRSLSQSPQALNMLMAELNDIAKKHGIHFPKDFALLTKQLLYFDRFMVMLAPEMDIFEGERLGWLEGL